MAGTSNCNREFPLNTHNVSENMLLVQGYRPVTGDDARRLPHIQSAIDPTEGLVNPKQVVSPKFNPTFSLTIIEVPWSTIKTFPGIIAYRTFTVKLQRHHFVFAVGDWEETVGNSAIVQCFSYTESKNSDVHDLFPFGEQGLLRIPKKYIERLTPLAVPSPKFRTTDQLQELWDAISYYRRWDVLLTFPTCYTHEMGGSWSVTPTPIFTSERVAEAKMRVYTVGMVGHGMYSDGEDWRVRYVEGGWRIETQVQVAERERLKIDSGRGQSERESDNASAKAENSPLMPRQQVDHEVMESMKEQTPRSSWFDGDDADEGQVSCLSWLSSLWGC